MLPKLLAGALLAVALAFMTTLGVVHFIDYSSANDSSPCDHQTDCTLSAPVANDSCCDAPCAPADGKSCCDVPVKAAK